jgi:NADPH-dependent 2,4-dienoyl-CoA reductase/sulfur reductase-like enzyme
VFAVGDCAAFQSARYGRRLRFEHWDVALHAPEVVAANVLGGNERYDPVPYFWSEQFGRMVQYVGFHGDADRLVWRGEPGGGPGSGPGSEHWALGWLSGDRLVALLTVGLPRDLMQGRRLIGAGGRVDAARLADPAVPVKDSALT